MSNFQVRRKTDFIVIHASATRPSQDIGAAEITRWHRQAGYTAIGYHFVIRRNGVVEIGRPEGVVGAHTRGFNSNSVGICMVGGVTEANVKVAENNYTPEQFASLKQLVSRLHRNYPRAIVQGHRDFPGVAKACPSFDAKAWWAANK